MNKIRIILGILIAPIIAPTVFIIADRFPPENHADLIDIIQLLLLGYIPISYEAHLCIGIPIIIILFRKKKMCYQNCIAIAAIIGATIGFIVGVHDNIINLDSYSVLYYMAAIGFFPLLNAFVFCLVAGVPWRLRKNEKDTSIPS